MGAPSGQAQTRGQLETVLLAARIPLQSVDDAGREEFTVSINSVKGGGKLGH